MSNKDKKKNDEKLNKSSKLEQETSAKNEANSVCEVRRRIEDYLTKKQLMSELGDEANDLDWAVE